MKRILILGGTTEARLLAASLAGRPDFAVTVSLAGRTTEIVAQNAPTRIGGFGGVAGLVDYLDRERIDALVDATHPYAEVISAHAVAAAEAAGIELLALRRPAWSQAPGDIWTVVATMAEAVATLGYAPQRVFLAIGRKEIAAFAAAPQHAYLVRSVDPVTPPPALPNATYVLGRGPFREAGDLALMTAHAIKTLVCRNSGGSAGYAKIAAARRLGLEVVIVDRPTLPAAATVETVEAALAWLDHVPPRRPARGV
jgi:precorrin-6A/cobalt-precorrin-6A reductase